MTSSSISSSSSSYSSSDKILYLLRGVPGSGKSTFSKTILAGSGIDTSDDTIVKQHVLSTDDFFIGEDGKYNFNPKKLGFNHQQNQERAEKQMRIGVTPLFIDNTNIAAWEMKPYVVLADRYGYKVIVVNPIDYSREDNPILTDEGKINRELIKGRAEERRRDGSGKDIPDVAFDGLDGRPGMFDRLEENMQMTPDDVRASIKPSFNRGNASTRKPGYSSQRHREPKDPREASDDFKRKYLKYKNKYLSLKQKLSH
jgi:predicted kinase